MSDMYDTKRRWTDRCIVLRLAYARWNADIHNHGTYI
jgi:hypothetical protein